MRYNERVVFTQSLKRTKMLTVSGEDCWRYIS